LAIGDRNDTGRFAKDNESLSVQPSHERCDDVAAVVANEPPIQLKRLASAARFALLIPLFFPFPFPSFFFPFFFPLKFLAPAAATYPGTL
jgi:hypothetical protein